MSASVEIQLPLAISAMQAGETFSYAGFPPTNNTCSSGIQMHTHACSIFDILIISAGRGVDAIAVSQF